MKYVKSVSKILLVSVLVSIFAIASPAQARVTKVRSYIKPSTGKIVTSHFKTTPNKTKLDNFSTKGNTNPFTGKKGTVNPFRFK